MHVSLKLHRVVFTNLLAPILFLENNFCNKVDVTVVTTSNLLETASKFRFAIRLFRCGFMCNQMPGGPVKPSPLLLVVLLKKEVNTQC